MTDKNSNHDFLAEEYERIRNAYIDDLQSEFGTENRDEISKLVDDRVSEIAELMMSCDQEEYDRVINHPPLEFKRPFVFQSGSDFSVALKELEKDNCMFREKD